MSDVTRILSQIDAGDPSAAEKLLPLVYEDSAGWRPARAADARRPDQETNAEPVRYERRRWCPRSLEFGDARPCPLPLDEALVRDNEVLNSYHPSQRQQSCWWRSGAHSGRHAAPDRAGEVGETE
jgi:hypothetical protein